MHNKPEYPAPDLFTVDFLIMSCRRPMLELRNNWHLTLVILLRLMTKECIAFCVHKQVKSKSGATITIVVPIFVSIARTLNCFETKPSHWSITLKWDHDMKPLMGLCLLVPTLAISGPCYTITNQKTNWVYNSEVPPFDLEWATR